MSYTPQPTDLFAVFRGNAWRVIGWVAEEVEAPAGVVTSVLPVLLNEYEDGKIVSTWEFRYLQRYGRLFTRWQSAVDFNAENPEYGVQEMEDNEF